MNKVLLLLLIAMCAVGTALAVTTDDVRIYINPGHGSWGPNDRPMATISYPMLSSTGRPDTCGFYESNTNLWKAFEMRDALKRMGVKDENITMSRTANGPYPYVAGASNATQYNRPLSAIAAEVEEGDYDMFVSIHSNADGNILRNYPLYLYRGTNASEAVTGSKAMCQTSWPRHWMNAVDPMSNYSATSAFIAGDVNFYGEGDCSYTTNSYSGISYYGYLGVLKHGVPGFLVEGYCHTYQPARHRALNQDYCRQEGVRLARGAADYFGISGENTGYIMGSVKDAVNSLDNSLYNYMPNTVDANAPINGAVVKLYKSGTLVGTYTTDNNYNGIFVFNNLAPGNDYTINVTANGYTDLNGTSNYTVTANETTYMVLYMEGGGIEAAKGIFAYDLNRTTDNAGNYVFTFMSNTNATAGYLVFTDSVSSEEVGRITLSDVVKGNNSVTLSPEDLPGTDGQVLSWAVNLVGEPITSIERVNSGAGSYTRATVAIDRSPESAHFGTIYVGERVGKENSGNGLYVCDVDGRALNTTVYRGGQALSNCFRICVDGEGKVYIPDWADPSSGIFIADPDNMSGAFTQFFVGTRNGDGLISNNGVAVGSSVPSVWVQGNGADAKLYAYLEDVIGPSGNGNGIGVYNIGQSDGSLLTTWGQAPSNYLDIGALQASTNGNIIADPEGRGVWVGQNRAKGQNTDGVPSLIFTDYSGNVLFNSGIDLTSLNGSGIAGFAINNTNDVLVINDGDGVLQFYDLTWNGNTPVLTANGMSYTADVGAYTNNCSNSIYQMAFDWGGNLVCAGKSIGIYSIPTDDNQSTTPARTALSVIKKEIPVEIPVKGIYAYALNSVENSDGSYTFTFNANSDAREAYLIFTDNTTGNEVGRVALENVVEGENTVTLTKDQLPGDNGQVMNWAVNVKGDAITNISRLNDHYADYTRAAVAIDRSPESAHFGTIYVGERVAKNDPGNGIYACDINGQPLHANVYNGGMVWANDMRLAVDCEGKVYIPEWGDATSGIYIADPDHLDGTWTQFFVGSRDDDGLITNNGQSVGGSVPGVWIQGTGADTKLYAFNEDVVGPSGKGNNVGIYNIGQSDGSLLTTWNQAPDQLLDVGSLMINGNGNIIADADGRGTWVMQYRSKGYNIPSVPSLIFVDNSGNVVFNSGSDLPSLTGSLMSGFAINNSNDLMVINDGDGVLQFYDISWNGSTPSLVSNGTTYVADARSGVNAIYQMAFDWGGNLVCAGGNIGIYSMPTDDNQSTTPAMSSLTVTKGASYVFGDVNCDNLFNVSDVITLINYISGYHPQPFSMEAADANQDSYINITDVTLLINWLVNN